MTPIAGQKCGATGTERRKMPCRILKVDKTGLERLFDGGISHGKNRHKLLEVAKHFMRVPAGNLFSQDIEEIGKGE